MARQANNTTHGEMVADGFATIKDAAEYLKISRASVYKLFDGGSLPWAKFGTKSRRIPWQALRAYATKSLVGV